VSDEHNSRKLTFSIQRGVPADLQSFQIDGSEGMTILEALLAVYRTQDSTLGFRYSCTVGRCYSCLLQMNGKSVASCREPMVDGAVIAPLRNRTVIRDLATDDCLIRQSSPRKDEAG
jgi:succinate dehydrogenase/fumarate reductase-like Fe-S protein